MNFKTQTKKGFFIVIILIIILCILYVLNSIKIKKNKNQNCNCNLKLDINNDDIPSQKQNNIENYNNNNKKNKLCLFFAKWCSHSRNFFPEWENCKKKINSNKLLSSKLSCVEFDCDNDKEMCRKYSVKGYPTILLHTESGKIINYNGQRETNDIIDFVNKNL